MKHLFLWLLFFITILAICTLRIDPKDKKIKTPVNVDITTMTSKIKF